MRITLDRYGSDKNWEINFKPDVGHNITFKLEEDEEITSQQITDLVLFLTRFKDIYVDVNFTAYKDERDD